MHESSLSRYAPSTTPPAPSGDWQFLEEWFSMMGDANVTTGYIDHTTDDVRVGCDNVDHAWLEISITRSALRLYEQQQAPGVDHDAIHRAELASQRDAILLTSLVAKVDYDGWLDMMLEYTEFELEGPFKIPDANGKIPHVPIRFECEISDQHSLVFLDWSSSLGYVFGDLGHSAAFTRDVVKVHELLAKRGVSMANIPPTPIKWKLAHRTQATNTLDGVGRWIMRTVEAIQHVQRLDEQAVKDRSSGSRAVLFKVALLDVSLYGVQLENDVLEALLALLRVGVPIARLQLPVLGSSTPSISRWGPFVRLLTGIDQGDDGRHTSVRRIEMPLSYAKSFHFAAFCSALSCARGVEVFCLKRDLDPEHSQEKDPFGWHEEARRHVWRWLVFALFSKASTTSVTTLYIDGETPKPTDIAMIKNMGKSVAPLEVLFQAADPDLPATDVPRIAKLENSSSVATIPRMTIFEASDGMRTADCQCSHELSGELLSLPASRPIDDERVVFVPGFGLCRHQQLERPLKRVKTAALPTLSPPALKSLVLVADPRSAMAPDMLLALLKMIGPQLKGLRFSMGTDDDEAPLDQVFQLCPHLQSLSLKDTRLSSMDVFDHAFARGIRLTSLCLIEIQVPASSLHEFLRKLTVKQPHIGTAVYALERLAIVFGAASEENKETLKLVERVLQQNTTLTHVDGLYQFAGFVSFAFDEYHAQRIPGLSRQQIEQRTAFLRAMWAVSQSTPALGLDSYLKQRIWDFTVSPRYRCVGWIER